MWQGCECACAQSCSQAQSSTPHLLSVGPTGLRLLHAVGPLSVPLHSRCSLGQASCPCQRRGWLGSCTIGRMALALRAGHASRFSAHPPSVLVLGLGLHRVRFWLAVANSHPSIPVLPRWRVPARFALAGGGVLCACSVIECWALAFGCLSGMLSSGGVMFSVVHKNSKLILAAALI